MPRKKPARLPSVEPGIAQRLRAEGHFQSSVDYKHGSLGEPSELSTCLPVFSHDDVQGVSEVFDESLRLPAALGVRHSTDSEGELQVQSVEEIIGLARRQVQARKPWREEIDDAILEKRRQADLQERVDRSHLIILPDNRVRTMDTQLSRRVRAQLLGEEDAGEAQQAPLTRKREEVKANPRRVRNPWYLPPSEWFASKVAKDTAEREGANVHVEVQEIAEDVPRRLTQREKETLPIVEAYRQHMKGSRLPRFLQ